MSHSTSKLRVLSKKTDSKALADALVAEGRALLPMLELITTCQMAVDDLISATGKAVVEAVLRLSAEEVAGPPHPGKKGGDIRRHSPQQGAVPLADRTLHVTKPRLRHKKGGPGAEVPLPAYEAMRQQPGLGATALKLLMAGVSTRKYAEVIEALAGESGVSKSTISREFVEASAEQVKTLLERPLGQRDFLILYMDGIQFAGHHVLAAVGVDVEGRKHVLGFREGASENTTVVTELLQDLVRRGLEATKKYLFVIDGSKALRAGITAVFGAETPVQRCRQHKMRNVLDHLPKEDQERAQFLMKGAYQLEKEKGVKKLRELAQDWEKSWPDAAGSLREGLEETFTINMLGLPAGLRRGLATTNVIESLFSSARRPTRRVTNWQSGEMVQRWAATSLLAAEKRFHKLMGFKDLWVLAQKLGRATLDVAEKAA